MVDEPFEQIESTKDEREVQELLNFIETCSGLRAQLLAQRNMALNKVAELINNLMFKDDKEKTKYLELMVLSAKLFE